MVQIFGALARGLGFMVVTVVVAIGVALANICVSAAAILLPHLGRGMLSLTNLFRERFAWRLGEGPRALNLASGWGFILATAVMWALLLTGLYLLAYLFLPLPLSPRRLRSLLILGGAVGLVLGALAEGGDGHGGRGGSYWRDIGSLG